MTENLKQRAKLAIYSGNGTPAELLAPPADALLMTNSFSDTKVSQEGWMVSQFRKETSTATEYGLAMWNPQHQLVNLPSEAAGWSYRANLTKLPNDRMGLVAVRGQNADGLVIMQDNQGTMQPAQTLSGHGIQFMSADGSGITRDNKIWRNGKLKPLRDLCERYGEMLDDGWTFHPLKANSHGIYLIAAEGPNGEKRNQLMVRIEVLVPTLDSEGEPITDEFITTEELKVAKWENAFGGIYESGFVKDGFIDLDRDRFYIRIPGGANLGIEAAMVATEDCPDLEYNDDPTRIDLPVSGPHRISDSMILVADDDDDDFEGSGAGADDQPGDRTHRVQLGGTFRVKSLIINDVERPVNRKVSVPAKKKLHIDFYRMNVEDTCSIPVINNGIKLLKERFAQVAVQIEDSVDPEGLNWPTLNPLPIAPGYLDVYDGTFPAPLTAQYKDFMDKVESHGVNFYFTLAGAAGKAIAINNEQIDSEPNLEVNARYINNVIVGAQFPVGLGNTLGHELMHLLAYRTDGEDDHTQRYCNLLATHNVNKLPAVLLSKRINQTQQSMINYYLYSEDLP